MAGTPSSSVTSSGSGAMAQLFRSVASGAVASIDAPGLSQAYNHLRVVVVARSDQGAGAVIVNMRLNNDSAGNYEAENILGIGALSSAAEGIAGSGARIGAAPGTAQVAGACMVCDIIIPDYALTTFHKTWAGSGFRKDANTTGNLVAESPSGAWRSTAAVTRVTILPASGNLIAGSSMTIYGIL